MQKIERNALAVAGVAGGANKGPSTSASSTSVVMVQVAGSSSSSSSQPAKH
ncbi:hypothetical protein QYH69_03610 [Paraburkholderia sp. SARCC-3016]|jgi:hypothetical protein|uniref:hypothetical protein n=1 Tax=Paraburkholderia sp. SARCC-3016 TaxID=3058611 RepID=UPI00280A3FCE|nr:hypothetical protein [Paraburkholderia sp. SARCC-3016]MDQ7976329.1 hypothetical protein [Paraburkholderia sp. SARCC-3016]